MIHYKVCVSKGVCEAYDNDFYLGGVYASKASEEELLKMAEKTVLEHKEKMKELIQKYLKEAKDENR